MKAIETKEELEKVITDFLHLTKKCTILGRYHHIKPFIESLNKPVAGWYKNHNHDLLLAYFDGKYFRHGISTFGEWMPMCSSIIVDSDYLASRDEVSNALVEYAKKRYKGKTVKCLNDGDTNTVDGSFRSRNNEVWASDYMSHIGVCLFDGKGNWAEIVDDNSKKIADYEKAMQKIQDEINKLKQ